MPYLEYVQKVTFQTFRHLLVHLPTEQSSLLHGLPPGLWRVHRHSYRNMVGTVRNCSGVGILEIWPPSRSVTWRRRHFYSVEEPVFIESQMKAVPFFLTSISVIFTLAPYISTECLLTGYAQETVGTISILPRNCMETSSCHSVSGALAGAGDFPDLQHLTHIFISLSVCINR